MNTVLKVTCADEVQSRPISWIWPGRLAAGHLTLIVGAPGDGKSQISCDVAARITTGETWPDRKGRAAIGSVVMLSAEDSLADVIKPRLEVAGADVKKVHVVEGVNDDGQERGFDLQADIANLKHLVADIGNVKLIIIDPITSYMGTKIDSHRTTDVRSVLQPLARFAEETEVAVLAISHPPKAAQAKAINAATGSLAFVAAARLFFLTATEPETKRRLLLPVKNNLGALSDGLGYRIVPRMVANEIETSRIAWDGAPVTMTADDAMRSGGNGAAKLEDAKAFLREFLADGPATADDVQAAADKDRIKRKTLRRAREELGIRTQKQGFDGGWIWSMPESATVNPLRREVAQGVRRIAEDAQAA
jgi:hypothetical protein